MAIDEALALWFWLVCWTIRS